MGIRDKLGELARQARAEAQHRAPTSEQQRAKRAAWGESIIQLATLLHQIGARLTASAYEDAEHARALAWDAGYEQHRADVAPLVDEHQAAAPVDELGAVDEHQAAAAAADGQAAAFGEQLAAEDLDEHQGAGHGENT